MAPKGKPKKAPMSTDWQSKSATSAAVSRFEADFLKTFGMDAGSDRKTEYDVISTGSLALDTALTIGGIPSGRIIEYWGPEHAGKTTLAIMNAVQAQKQYPDKRVAWIDMEQTFDSSWAERLGLDLARVWRPPVKTAEQVSDLVKRFTMSGLCSMVVIDSVGSMISKTEFEKDAEESTVGLVAKVVTRMVKECSPICASNNTTVVVINQVRSIIGAMYGPTEDTAGGWALKHVTSVKVAVRRGETRMIKVLGEDMPCGYEMVSKVQKNKMGPFGQVSRVMVANMPTEQYGPIGVDMINEVCDMGIKHKVVEMRGGGYGHAPCGADIRGKDGLKDHLREHPEDVPIIRERLLEKLGGTVAAEPEEAEDDPAGMVAFLEGQES